MSAFLADGNTILCSRRNPIHAAELISYLLTITLQCIIQNYAKILNFVSETP